MKARCTTSSLKWREQAKNGFIPAHQNQKIPHVDIHRKNDVDANLGSPRPTCRAPHIEFNVTSASYCNLLRNHLRPTLSSKFCGLLSTSVLLLHDNARLHSGHMKAEMIRDIHSECLPHLPYLADFAPCDYHIFGPLKEVLEGKTFQFDKEVQEAVHQWLCMQPKDIFSWRIQAFVKHWKTCIEHNGEHVEKSQSCTEPICTTLAGKKMLRFSFDSPTYIHLTQR
jgi:hypothetical protein